MEHLAPSPLQLSASSHRASLILPCCPSRSPSRACFQISHINSCSLCLTKRLVSAWKGYTSVHESTCGLMALRFYYLLFPCSFPEVLVYALLKRLNTTLWINMNAKKKEKLYLRRLFKVYSLRCFYHWTNDSLIEEGWQVLLIPPCSAKLCCSQLFFQLKSKCSHTTVAGRSNCKLVTHKVSWSGTGKQIQTAQQYTLRRSNIKKLTRFIYFQVVNWVHCYKVLGFARVWTMTWRNPVRHCVLKSTNLSSQCITYCQCHPSASR